ncbi:MAG: hypothetical protein IJF90_09360 [Synergistaceae bacterium]|nr:hypothetical protein [Synergistaceae bacterium]
MKYLEYDRASGRILSEITSSQEPPLSDGVGYLKIEDGEYIDSTLYRVRDGAVVKAVESNAEQLERERRRRERMEQNRQRLRSMCYEYTLAMLADDVETVKALKREYQGMKAYI